jgi:hypothetical protein
MRQASALGCEHAVLQSPSLVLPETPLQHQYQPVFAVQTVGAPAQTSLAADMKLGITGTRDPSSVRSLPAPVNAARTPTKTPNTLRRNDL